MTRQIDWHANFEALLNRTPHDAAGLGKTARREAQTSAGLSPADQPDTPRGPAAGGLVRGHWVARLLRCRRAD